MRTLELIMLGSFIAWPWACTPEPPAPAPPVVAPPPAPVAAPVDPEPPALTGDPSRCVVRRYDRRSRAWKVTSWTYDPVQRTLQGDWMSFDAEGRMVKRVDADTTLIDAYDAHGNLREEAYWKNDELLEGTRWRNRYEGDPPRLASIEISDFRTPKDRDRPRMRMRFTYDASHRLASMTRESARGTELHVYAWHDDRVVSIRSSLSPRHRGGSLPYDAERAFEYDAHKRVTKMTVDGELPFGEGATADGELDHVRTFAYDASGRLERMESDGRGGDVAPGAPDGKADTITLFSPPCDPIAKLAPQWLDLPDLGLPNSVEPALR